MADQLDPKVDDRFDIGDTSIDPILDNLEDAPAPKKASRNGKKEKGDTELRWLDNMDRYWTAFQANLAAYYANKALK